MDYVPSSTGLWWQMALRGLRVFPSSSVWLGEGKINIRSAAQNIHMNQRFIDWKIRNNSRNVKVFEDRLSLRSCDGEVAIQDRNPCLCGTFMPNEVKVDSRPSELAALTKTNVCVHSTWQRTAKRKKMTAVFAWPSGNLVFLFCHLSSFVPYSPQYDVSGEEAGGKCSDVQSAVDCLGHWCSPCALAGLFVVGRSDFLHSNGAVRVESLGIRTANRTIPPILGMSSCLFIRTISTVKICLPRLAIWHYRSTPSPSQAIDFYALVHINAIFHQR